MSKSLTINAPQIVQTRNTLNAVPSGSTAEPDYSVKFVPQYLTEAQQAQARQNIGAAAAGEGGGATVNEFHYKRGGEEGNYYFYIDCPDYTPKDGDLMVVIFDWIMDPTAGCTLRNGTDVINLDLRNAPASEYNYYDDIYGTPNTRWTVKLEKDSSDNWHAYNISTIEFPDWNVTDEHAVGYIKNKPTIPAAQIQSDWNQADTAAPDFIKNKPTIPAAQVQSDWNESNTASLAYIQNKPTIPTVPIVDNKPLSIPEDARLAIIIDAKVSEWGTNSEFARDVWYHYSEGALDTSTGGKHLVGQGRNIFVRIGGEIYHVDIKFEDTAGDYKIKINNNGLTKRCFNFNTVYTGNIIIMWGSSVPVYRGHTGGFKDTVALPICTGTLYTYFMNNQWPKNGSDARLTGNIVMVDKPFQLIGADSHDASLPDMTNVTAVYVPRSRSTEFASFMDYGYGPGNWSTIEAKVVYYDFITWVDDMTPKIINLPTTT